MCHLWFLVYQRVPSQLHLHLLLHHLHHRVPYLMSTDTRKIQYQKEVEVRVKSFGETRCINRQKSENKNNKGREEVSSDLLHDLPDWLQDSRERIWSMNVVPESHGETPRQRIETLPVLLMNNQRSREHQWNRVRVSIVSTRTFRRTQIAIAA